MDGNNRDLFESGCLKDENMVVAAGPVTLEGWPKISEYFSRVFDLITTHIVSNTRIELKDGADTASMTANALSYHVRPDDAFKPEDTSYTASCLYNIDLVRDSADGLWKIKKWEFRILWTTGDIKVLHR
jgi:hypothetical protein